MGICHSSNPEGLFVYCKEKFDIYWNGEEYKIGYNGICPTGYKKVDHKIIFYPRREVHVLEINKCFSTYYNLRFSPTWCTGEGSLWISEKEYKTYWREYYRKTNDERRF